MDSPTRRQLVVGFLEPAEKKHISAEEASYWRIGAVNQSVVQTGCRTLSFSFFPQEMSTPPSTDTQEGRNSERFFFNSAPNEKDLFAAKI